MTQTMPRFLQTTFNFKGLGYERPIALHALSYQVPQNAKSKIVYFRAGNSSDDLVNLTLLRDGATMRLFPLGMKNSMHFPMAIQEYIPPGTKLELELSAPEGLHGSVFIDIGLMEEKLVEG